MLQLEQDRTANKIQNNILPFPSGFGKILGIGFFIRSKKGIFSINCVNGINIIKDTIKEILVHISFQYQIWLLLDKVLYFFELAIWMSYNRQPTTEKNDNFIRYKKKALLFKTEYWLLILE